MKIEVEKTLGGCGAVEIWNEEKLIDLLTKPSPNLVDDLKRIPGDIMILGAGGKMGPSMAILASRAVAAAGLDKRIIAVSRFSDTQVVQALHDHHVETISMDLGDQSALDHLPDAANIIYLAGRKFGTQGQESQTWHMNASIPTLVTRRFRTSRIVVFSTGNVFPLSPPSGGGCMDEAPLAPVGEYAMSTLARERIFEYAASQEGSAVLIYRLNYAVDLHYGVLYDLAVKILRDEPISVRMPCFNCVWQGYANEVALRSLRLAASPAAHLNVTGPETVSVRQAATLLGQHLGHVPVFEGVEGGVALLSNAGRCFEQFGYPRVTLQNMIRWQAEWLLSGGRTWNKPTHFEEQQGNF